MSIDVGADPSSEAACVVLDAHTRKIVWEYSGRANSAPPTPWWLRVMLRFQCVEVVAEDAPAARRWFAR